MSGFFVSEVLAKMHRCHRLLHAVIKSSCKVNQLEGEGVVYLGIMEREKRMIKRSVYMYGVTLCTNLLCVHK